MSQFSVPSAAGIERFSRCGAEPAVAAAASPGSGHLIRKFRDPTQTTAVRYNKTKAKTHPTTRCPVTCKFQINNEFVFQRKHVPNIVGDIP